MAKTPMSNPPTPQRGRPRREVDPGARERLLGAAAVLFAEQGFAETSTREICTAAGLNPGAIHYHFGDKDGLYRAVLARPLEVMTAQYQGFDAQGLSLREGLDLFIGSFLSDTADELELRLHLREMLNPSAIYATTVVEYIGPNQKALAELLARHIGTQADDEAVLQLGYGLVAMAQDYCLSRAFMKMLTPNYLEAPGALARIRTRLVDWAEALIAFEKARHAAAPKKPAVAKKKPVR